MRQLAERSDVDVGVISRVERGQYKPPKITTIEKLSRALELSEAEKEELLRLSARLESKPPAVKEAVARPETEKEMRDRLTALEERVRRLEGWLRGDGNDQGQ